MIQSPQATPDSPHSETTVATDVDFTPQLAQTPNFASPAKKAKRPVVQDSAEKRARNEEQRALKELRKKLGLEGNFNARKNAIRPGDLETPPSAILAAHNFPLKACIKLLRQRGMLTTEQVLQATNRELQESILKRASLEFDADDSGLYVNIPKCRCITVLEGLADDDDPTDPNSSKYHPLAEWDPKECKWFVTHFASCHVAGRNEQYGRGFNFGKSYFRCSSGMGMKEEKTMNDKLFNMRASADACDYWDWAIQVFCDLVRRGTILATPSDVRAGKLDEWAPVLLSFLTHDGLVENWLEQEEMRKKAAEARVDEWGDVDDDLFDEGELQMDGDAAATDSDA